MNYNYGRQKQHLVCLHACDIATVLEVISVHLTVHPRLIAAFLQPIELQVIFMLACLASLNAETSAPAVASGSKRDF